MNLSGRRWLLLGAVWISTLATAQQVGDRVLGQWPADGLWYPARVKSVTGDGVDLAFDDGDVARVRRDAIRPIGWKQGTRLQCNFGNRGQYFDASVASIDGETLDIAYDDGSSERATISRCRSQ